MEGTATAFSTIGGRSYHDFTEECKRPCDGVHPHKPVCWADKKNGAHQWCYTEAGYKPKGADWEMANGYHGLGSMDECFKHGVAPCEATEVDSGPSNWCFDPKQILENQSQNGQRALREMIKRDKCDNKDIGPFYYNDPSRERTREFHALFWRVNHRSINALNPSTPYKLVRGHPNRPPSSARIPPSVVGLADECQSRRGICLKCFRCVLS